MLQLDNATPFKAELMLLPDRRGIDTVYTVVKATFDIAPSLRVAAKQRPVTLVDEHYGEPETSSIRAASDVSIGKPGTDVLINGSAWAPGGTPTWQMDVMASIGPLGQTLRVFGDRRWESSGVGATVAWVAPFLKMPLLWERAFGGADVTEDGPTAEARNPVGTGFRVPNGSKPLTGLALPNVEDPAALITSWTDAPTPAGFGAVAPHWLPRRAFAGTYDTAWQQRRSPYLPDDFDPRFCQVAPLGLVTPVHLRGGELVQLRGLTKEGVLQFALPTLALFATYVVDRSPHRRECVLDTVVIEPDENRLMMVWRASLQCDKKAPRVREVELACGTSSGIAA